MTFRSVIEIRNATSLLDDYCLDSHRYAWPLYDEDPSPNTLCGADIAVTAFLSYPIPNEYLKEMGRKGTEYEELVSVMRAFVALPSTLKFVDLDEAHIEALAPKAEIIGPPEWQAFIKCLRKMESCSGLTSVAVTKILHRKRPDLVPINDSLVREFYVKAKKWNYVDLARAIWTDLQRPETREYLSNLTGGRATPAGRLMTDLRALDIVVWMDQRTK